MSKCNGDSSEGPVQRVGLTETSDNCEARLVSFTPFIPTSGPVTVSPPLENTPRLASIRELSDVTAQAVRSMLPTGRDNDDDEILLDAADVDVMQNYEQQTQRQSDEGQKENTDTQEATSSPLTTSRLAKPEMHVVYDAAWIRKKFHIGDEFLRAVCTNSHSVNECDSYYPSLSPKSIRRIRKMAKKAQRRSSVKRNSPRNGC
ncbi:hypothetical protein CALVIDRAFT_142534 [Calocera viscosa TUFC12733]|uniref:Uncharacterized protein n=1 Tax=Calocera viscosa (strain TUFC12733) TaxID=1330018 RepID=A0A167LQT9_CALVF|nr:hypothetical protein CALVIDRAFT_142534 [Calocera viscosa TUFC12733]